MAGAEKILILDDGDTTGLLIQAAAAWREKIGPRPLEILRVVDESVLRDTTRAMGVFGPLARRVRDEFTRKDTDEIRRVLDEQKVSSETAVRVIPGHPLETLKKEIDRSAPALLVLSPSLKGPLGPLGPEIIGYTANNCLVIPASPLDSSSSSILLASGNPDEDRPAVESALKLAERLGTSLHILSVVPLNDELLVHGPDLLDDLRGRAHRYVEEIAERARRQGLTAIPAVIEGGVAESIAAQAGEIRPALLVLGSFRRTGVPRLFMGSVSAGIMGKVSAPFLVVKQPI